MSFEGMPQEHRDMMPKTTALSHEFEKQKEAILNSSETKQEKIEALKRLDAMVRLNFEMILEEAFPHLQAQETKE
jgi:hypothetical protein